MAKLITVLTTMLRSIYLAVRPLNMSPTCVDKHCSVYEAHAPQLGS
jgi:hypothetical protein